MTAEDKLSELLDAATAEVPADHLAPPLAQIHGRVRARRRTLAVAAAAVTAVLVAGGFPVAQRLLASPAQVDPGGTDGARTVVSWTAVMAARDDRTITVYAGSRRCEELTQPRARLTEQGADRISIEVTRRVAGAGECVDAGPAVPMTLTLDGPLGDRRVLDALRGPEHPVYYERLLPDMRSDSRWTPVDDGGWRPEPDRGWYRAYDGPDGLTLALYVRGFGEQGTSTHVAKLAVGPYDGSLGRDATRRFQVWWIPGPPRALPNSVIYGAQIVQADGEPVPLERFKEELALLRWS